MIRKFEGKYAFLSNFYPSPIQVGLNIYPTVEHAFQAYKTLEPRQRVQIRDVKTPGVAKKLGRQVALRRDWEDIKFNVMRSLLWCKFLQHPELACKLIDTGTYVIVEGNTWHDNTWGSCTCAKCGNNGRNHLGEMLMGIRQALVDINYINEID
jgi:ribA/ribD-fused uncharacterized protein